MTNILRYLIIPSILLAALSSCNRISQGEQRQKFEYLYGMKAQLSLLMDESYYLNSTQRLSSYKDDIKDIKRRVSELQPLEGWDEGAEIKKKFMDLIDRNLNLTDSLIATGDSINFESNVTIDSMKAVENDLMEELDALISKVGRE